MLKKVTSDIAVGEVTLEDWKRNNNFEKWVSQSALLSGDVNRKGIIKKG